MEFLLGILIGFIVTFWFIVDSWETVNDKNLKSGIMKDSEYNHYKVIKIDPETLKD